MSTSDFTRVCDRCKAAYPYKAYNCKLVLFIDNPECNYATSKCDQCSHWNVTYLRSAAVIAYRETMRIQPHNVFIHSHASADRKAEAMAAWKHAEAEKVEDEIPTIVPPEVFDLTDRMENDVSTLRNQLDNFTGFPCKDISFIEGAPVKKLPERWNG